MGYELSLRILNLIKITSNSCSMLVEGSYYTGTDDEAMKFVRINNVRVSNDQYFIRYSSLVSSFHFTGFGCIEHIGVKSIQVDVM
ncbi:hypothetical protein EPI10_020494 [Gossypium australe]|uniref:Uncharacterized protein n=1 Tax=Gossypium australe TaxID=47621 RepID=A0A5B6WF28_9ROSI|nr:hypothetical protein EPI10_020494 [Gossypium australe]